MTTCKRDCEHFFTLSKQKWQSIGYPGVIYIMYPIDRHCVGYTRYSIEMANVLCKIPCKNCQNCSEISTLKWKKSKKWPRTFFGFKLISYFLLDSNKFLKKIKRVLKWKSVFNWLFNWKKPLLSLNSNF